MTICNRPNDPEDLPSKDEQHVQPNTADKAAAGQQQRIVRRALALDEEGFVEIAAINRWIVVVEVGGAHRIAAHDHVAVIVLVELQGELLRDRQGMKPPGLGEGALDQRLRHAVPGQHEKADRRQCVMHLARGGGQRSRPAGGIVRDIDDRDRLAHARLQRKGNGIMAQIAARLLRNLGFLFKACGEPLEAVGERQQLLAAARLEPHFLGDAPEPHGDLAEMCHPILRKVLGHRHRLPPSATL